MCFQQLSVVRCHGLVPPCTTLSLLHGVSCALMARRKTIMCVRSVIPCTRRFPLVLFLWCLTGVFDSSCQLLGCGGLCLSQTLSFTVGQRLFRGCLRAYAVVGLLIVLEARPSASFPFPTPTPHGINSFVRIISSTVVRVRRRF